MDNDDLINELEEWEFVTPPLYLRVWWRFWGSPVTYHHGWRYWREGLYMWIAAHLPAEVVSLAAMRLVPFADERGLTSWDIVNVASYWDLETELSNDFGQEAVKAAALRVHSTAPADGATGEA